MQQPEYQQLPDSETKQEIKNPYSWAYIIGASIVIASIVISASAIYNVKLIVKQISKTSFATSPSAPTAGNTGNPSAPTAPTGPVNINLAANTPFLGNANAKVTVVEYADYQCPFCEKFFTDVFPQIKAKYIDTGKIKFMYQDFAFLGADSTTAGEATHCAADQNKFWQYHDYLFSHQGQENSGWATLEHQKEFAAVVGLNANQFNQCMTSHKYATEVANQTTAGKGFGVTGTPTVFVNGNIIVGAQPFTSFSAAIDAALAK